MLRDRILSEIRSRLEKAFGERLRGVVLYGSQARGDTDPESDLDLMVLLDGPVKLGFDLKTIVEALYPVQLDLERPIHALPVSLTAFEAGHYGVYRNAKREGVFL